MGNGSWIKDVNGRIRNFQWTDDEKYCARMVTGEVQFWESKNCGKSVWARLKLEGIAQFSLSPGKAPAVAVFIPERKVRYGLVIHNVSFTYHAHTCIGCTCYCTHVQHSQLQSGSFQQDFLQGRSSPIVLE